MNFSKNEIEFLQSLEEARIATSHDDIPHVKPVSYIFYQNCIIIATDYETRTFQNIKKNARVAITIDKYKSGGHQAICLQGKGVILEKGEEFNLIYKLFDKKFKWVRDDPWTEGEAPFLKIISTNKSSWGIN